MLRLLKFYFVCVMTTFSVLLRDKNAAATISSKPTWYKLHWGAKVNSESGRGNWTHNDVNTLLHNEACSPFTDPFSSLLMHCTPENSSPNNTPRRVPISTPSRKMPAKFVVDRHRKLYYRYWCPNSAVWCSWSLWLCHNRGGIKKQRPHL